MENSENTSILIKELIGHVDSVLDVCYSPDGSKIASGSEDETIKIWDAMTLECIFTVTGHGDVVSWVVFSSDNKYLISAGGIEKTKFWENLSLDKI